MLCRVSAFGLALGLLCWPSAAQAIIIEAAGKRVYGYFVRDDGKKLTIREYSADGKEKETEFDRAKTKIRIIHQLDRSRLEELTKARPKAYRDFAEELAEQKADPEARDTAMRLYLIAAYLDPDKFGKSSLLAMSALARTPAESRKCVAMAFLLDAKADVATLKAGAAKTLQLTKTQVGALQDFAKALRSYRAGLILAAKEAANRQAVDQIFGLAPGMFDQRNFLQKCTDASCVTCRSTIKGMPKGHVLCTTCNGKGATSNMFGGFAPCTQCNGKRVVPCSSCDGTGLNPIPEDVMRVVLKAEMWALDQIAGSDTRDKKGTSETSWSSILQARQLHPVSPLSLEAITDIDPRKCVYRNGNWLLP
jgi:hypothetical protein